MNNMTPEEVLAAIRDAAPPGVRVVNATAIVEHDSTEHHRYQTSALERLDEKAKSGQFAFLIWNTAATRSHPLLLNYMNGGSAAAQCVLWYKEFKVRLPENTQLALRQVLDYTLDGPCSLCYDRLNKDPVELPVNDANCGHLFHEECAQDYAVANLAKAIESETGHWLPCPLCRALSMRFQKGWLDI
jgi:hypothetical protein